MVNKSFSEREFWCVEKFVDNEKLHYGRFILEPINFGQAITIGSSLRRILLGDITTLAITGVRINDLKHEYETLPGHMEDLLELLLNLKDMAIRSWYPINLQGRHTTLRLQTKGPKIVTASLFSVPDHILIVNPNKYITTITDESELYLEVDVSEGHGYLLKNREILRESINFSQSIPTTLHITNPVFNPIHKVNYTVKLISDARGHLRESLMFEIWTNGSVSPIRALQEANKIHGELFLPLSLFLLHDTQTVDEDSPIIDPQENEPK